MSKLSKVALHCPYLVRLQYFKNYLLNLKYFAKMVIKVFENHRKSLMWKESSYVYFLTKKMHKNGRFAHNLKWDFFVIFIHSDIDKDSFWRIFQHCVIFVLCLNVNFVEFSFYVVTCSSILKVSILFLTFSLQSHD